MNNRDKQIDHGSGSDSGSGGKRRMYDCNICMRGFTNPQALGGHRNLHRKERERNNSSSSSSHSFPFSIPLPSQSLPSPLNYTNPNYNNPPPYFPTIESYHHQTYQPQINPSYNTQRFGASSLSGGGRSYADQGEFLGLDLSLGLGSVNVDNDSHRRLPDARDSQPDQDDDLDLDLRLGCHHRY
ncbi:unnamed protein product [Microthlaspi erraticum]|uniref:C2H2-type domain-containing protein n=1 Tax=Microthlaspi erraticum TaxID=1685480 RepID=A0A6D2HHQ2_9BRAS|nr:unnamed protein product [Microthlaspi erraticum]